MEQLIAACENGSVSVDLLRERLIVDGFPEGASSITGIGSKAGCSLRGRAWKMLLGVSVMNFKYYLSLVCRGENERFGGKIKKDTNRTFATDVNFSALVSEPKLLRVLNAFVNDDLSHMYLQGMNALCGVFLYIMPELDAFYCFKSLILNLLPRYMTSNMEGVKEGCALADECLEILDPDLFNYIRKSSCSTSWVYAHQPVLTLSSGIPPLSTCVELWDVYLSGGVHLNIVFFVSYMVLMRNHIIKRIPDEKIVIISGRDYPPGKPAQLLEAGLKNLSRLNEAFVKKLEQHCSP